MLLPSCTCPAGVMFGCTEPVQVLLHVVCHCKDDQLLVLSPFSAVLGVSQYEHSNLLPWAHLQSSCLIAACQRVPGSRPARGRSKLGSLKLDRPLAHSRARTRDLLHTTETHEASLPIAPQKPRPLQSKGNYYFKVSEQVTSPIETLFSAHR